MEGLRMIDIDSVTEGSEGRPKLTKELKRSKSVNQKPKVAELPGTGIAELGRHCHRRRRHREKKTGKTDPIKYFFKWLVKLYNFYGFTPPSKQNVYNVIKGHSPPCQRAGDPFWSIVIEFQKKLTVYQNSGLKVSGSDSSSSSSVDHSNGGTSAGSSSSSRGPKAGLDEFVDSFVAQYNEDVALDMLKSWLLEKQANRAAAALNSTAPSPEPEPQLEPEPEVVVAPAVHVNDDDEEEDRDILTLHPEVLDIWDVELMTFCGISPILNI